MPRDAFPHLAPEFLIQGPDHFSKQPRNVLITTDAYYSPAEAMDFAIRIIRAVRDDVVLENRVGS